MDSRVLVFRIARLFLVLLIILIGTMSVFSRRGILDLKRMWDRNAQLETKISDLKSVNFSLKRRIDAFQTNSHEQERMVREVLGFLRPGEVLVDLE